MQQMMSQGLQDLGGIMKEELMGEKNKLFLNNVINGCEQKKPLVVL